MLRIAIIAGSTRPGRKALDVARWVHQLASTRSDARYELLDLAEAGLPELDEALPPMMGRYENEHTRAWADLIAGFDGFVFVTPEYNHSTSGALKNAIDYLFGEWNDKAAGFVSYGASSGGTRAVEHLRQIMAELKIADVRSQVALTFAEDFEEFTTFAPADRRREQATALFDDLEAWSGALAALRVS
jgi:NAD(P)H-dependent FMN reductase